MRLLNANGAPLGIIFRKHGQNNSYVLRITGKGQMTDIAADPNSLETCYERAIDRRLELLGLSDDAESWQLLASAYGKFLDEFGIEIIPVVVNEFKLKGK
jgi:hypothetical protein